MSTNAVYIVCGGKFHDFEYAQQQIQKHLHDLNIPISGIAPDYADVTAIQSTSALISYTADVLPSAESEAALDEFLSTGGRWFALHGTNSKIEIDKEGYADCPRLDSLFLKMLGSQFLAHPPKGQFKVFNAQIEHPLVSGIETFEVEDELYIIDPRGELDVLLYSEFNGKAMSGFKHREYYSDEKRPILYLRDWQQGQVLYFNLGHCRGHTDMRPLVDWYPEVERCSWQSPEFRLILDRGIKWLTHAV